MEKTFDVGEKIYHIEYDLKGVILKNTSNQYHETYKVEFINEFGGKQVYNYCSTRLMVRSS